MRTAAAVVIRDSVTLYSDPDLRTAHGRARLGDAFPIARLADSLFTVTLRDSSFAFLHQRDAGVVALPTRDEVTIQFGRRYHPYVLWFAARHFAASNPASVWAVPPSDRIAIALYQRLATDFPADTIVARPLQVPDLHVRYGAVEGHLRIAEISLADGDTVTAVRHLREVLDHHKALARVASLDALLQYTLGNVLSLAPGGLPAASRDEGVRILFDVVDRYPRDVVMGLAVHQVPSLLSARALTDLARFPAATVQRHARRLRTMMPIPAMRMTTDVALGRIAAARKQYPRADSFATSAFRGEPKWIDAVQGAGAPLRGNPRPAAQLLFDTWLARGADQRALEHVRRLERDTSLSADLRGLARKILLRAADHGTGSIADVESLTVRDDLGLWRARKDTGGYSTRTRTATLLRAGDWAGAPSIATLASGESLRVLYANAGLSRDGSGHALKVQTARGAIGWVSESALDARTWWTPLCSAPAGEARVIARTTGDRDGRVSLADVTGDGCIDAIVTGTGWTIDEPPFDEDRPSFMFDAVQVIDGATGATVWLNDSLSVNPTLPAPAGRGWIAVPGRGRVQVVRGTDGTPYATLRATAAALSGGPPLVWATDTLLVCASGDSIVAVDPRSGARLWRAMTPNGESVTAGPACDGRTVVAVAGITNASAFALDASSGSVVWRSTSPDHPAQAWIGGGTALVSNGIEMWAMNASDGKLRWNHMAPMSQDPYASTSTRDLECLPGRVALVAGEQLTALDAHTGRPVWSAFSAAPIVSSPVLVHTSDGDSLLACATADGAVSFFDAASGDRRARVPLREWSGDRDAAVAPNRPRWNTAWLSAAENVVAVAADDGGVHVLSAPRGR